MDIRPTSGEPTRPVDDEPRAIERDADQLVLRRGRAAARAGSLGDMPSIAQDETSESQLIAR